jgi:hypothetical protein
VIAFQVKVLGSEFWGEVLYHKGRPGKTNGPWEHSYEDEPDELEIKEISMVRRSGKKKSKVMLRPIRFSELDEKHQEAIVDEIINTLYQSPRRDC